MQLLEVGSHLKFRIPHATRDGIEAESPWGQVVGVINDHRVVIKVANDLFSSDLHGFYFDDLLELERVWINPDSVPIWQSVGKVPHEEADSL